MKVEIDVLDGYRRIAKNAGSRLGWRIVITCRPFDGWRDVLKVALDNGAELVELLPGSYVSDHREVARLVGMVVDRVPLSDENGNMLSAALERSLEDIKAFLEVQDAGEESSEDETAPEADDVPSILFTSLVGSKGLSAEHVFIVGLNDGHFPRDADAITDDEICSLLVALSRTRKCCHVISCKFAFNTGLRQSVFLGWIRRHLRRVPVDKDYDFAE